MLFHLFVFLSHTFEPLAVLNAFNYITFRAVMAGILSLTTTIALGPLVIRTLKKLSWEQRVKGYEPDTHKAKEGTPTMGGVLFIVPAVVTTLLLSDLRNPYIAIILVSFLSFAAIGWYDDHNKVKGNPEGVSARIKFLLQIAVSLVVIVLISLVQDTATLFTIYLPIFKNIEISISYLYILFAIFIIVGSSNSVNLTDGLDGLAIMPSVIAFATLGLYAYIAGSSNIANYLYVTPIPGTSELAIFATAIVGAGLGFLWYNAYPAQLFMGDTGSLSLGGSMAVMAIMIKQELILILIAGVFIAETLSVIMQVGYFKATKGKRIFKMSPLHHHFELSGIAEQKIVIRFWIVAFILALIAVSLLRIR